MTDFAREPGSSLGNGLDVSKALYQVRDRLLEIDAGDPVVVNVKDFGATGDGSTDDSAAVQEAHDSLDGFGTLVFPKGTYNLANTGLDRDEYVKIKGAGPYASVIRGTKTDGPLIRLNSGGGAESLGLDMEDISFDGNNVATIGIQFGQTGVSPFTGSAAMRNVVVRRFVEKGIHMVFSAYTRFDRVACIGNGDGIHFDKQALNANTSASFNACRFVGNTKRGAFIENGLSLWFGGVTTFEGNGEEGVYILMPSEEQVMRKIVFDNCYWEQNNFNRSGSGHFQFKTGNSGASIIQGLTIRDSVFTSATAGDFHMYLAKGRFFESHNEYLGPETDAVHCENSTACFVYGESDLNPTDYYATMGANVQFKFMQRGGENFALWHNAAGTITKVADIQPGGWTEY